MWNLKVPDQRSTPGQSVESNVAGELRQEQVPGPPFGARCSFADGGDGMLAARVLRKGGGSQASGSRLRYQEESMSKWIVVVLGLLAALPVAAQQGQQAPPTVAAFVRQLYMGNQRNIVASANKVPEEFYGLRPGPQM
jgi:hypothetical protein